MTTSIPEDPEPRRTSPQKNNKNNNFFNLLNVKARLGNLIKAKFLKKSAINTIDHPIIANIKSLYAKSTGDIMTPRYNIPKVSKHIKLEELKSIFATSKESIMLVYENTLDNILGFVTVHDLLLVDNNSYNIENLLRKPIVSPAAMHSTTLIQEMIKQNIPVALVVDECGGTDGIVKLDDILKNLLSLFVVNRNKLQLSKPVHI